MTAEKDIKQTRIVIWCRTNVEWDKMTYEAFCAQDLTEKEYKKMVPVIRLWDTLFSCSFFEFRSKLHQIAKSTWADADVNCEIAEGTEALGNLLDEVDDPIIVPVDDDDWFAPTLGTIRDSFRKGAGWTAWNDAIFHTGLQEQSQMLPGELQFSINKLFQIRDLLSKNNPEAVSRTNSIAFRPSTLTRNYSRMEVTDTLRYHARTGKLLGDGVMDRMPDNFCPAAGRHSIINRNLASISQIFPNIKFIMNHPLLLREHVCRLANYDADMIPDTYNWARTSVQKMCDLYRELVN